MRQSSKNTGPYAIPNVTADKDQKVNVSMDSDNLNYVRTYSCTYVHTTFPNLFSIKYSELELRYIIYVATG